MAFVLIPVDGVAPAGPPYMAVLGFGPGPSEDDPYADGDPGGSPPGPQDGDLGAPTELRYAELALDPVTGDLAFPIRIVRGIEAVAQRLRVRLRFFQGEWFLDRRQGIPYYRDIFRKNPNLAVINSIFRQVILGTPGVGRILKINSQVDPAQRLLTFTFDAQLEDGSIIRAIDEPFLVG